jgi:Zn-dependent peptidase ImmA (M78 family)
MSKRLSKRYAYQHPGYAFLNQYGSLQGEEDVFAYVDFLRREAGIEQSIPTDLSKIYDRFCIPEPLQVPLDEQQGILLDTYKGVILIKADDPIARQRFTAGHELVELLFDAQVDVQTSMGLSHWDDDRKEQLCDTGAAELLMPKSSFLSPLNDWGFSLETGKKLASLYQTSLMATLIRMLELTTAGYALVVWHYGLKPIEKRRTKPVQKKPRIRWQKTSANWQGGFIPKDKSIESDSLIAQAFQTAQSGPTTFVWGGKSIDCNIEAIPIKQNRETLVISLLSHS